MHPSSTMGWEGVPPLSLDELGPWKTPGSKSTFLCLSPAVTSGPPRTPGQTRERAPGQGTHGKCGWSPDPVSTRTLKSSAHKLLLAVTQLGGGCVERKHACLVAEAARG